jgi:hypothetical protein
LILNPQVWNPNMLRIALLAMTGAALALPAAAETIVKVNVAGLDAGATHATILQAAHQACAEELRNADLFELYYARPVCVAGAVARAEAAVPASRTASADAVRVVATR